MDKKWPIYKKELLGFGNPESSTGLCTLWTPKEKVLKHVGSENYLVAGQCYSKQEGINLILRHCLSNKKIHRIVLCGIDMSHTGDILLALKEKGVDEYNKVIGFETEIDKEIPLEAINRFRQNVDIIDKRDIKDYKELDYFLRGLENKEPWGEPEIYEKSLPKTPEFLPSERTGFVVRGKKVGDVWLKILDTVLKFGYIKRSHHGDDQQELISLVSVISDEDPGNIDWRDYFQFTKEHFKEYLPKLMKAEKIDGVSYVYGSRLRDFKGIDQIESIIKELKKALHSRRAVGVTWDVDVDHDSPESPCLDLIQALVQDKLYLTAYFRSNDMFGAWPENALALRAIQYEIAGRIGVKVGDLIIVSNSAHIYSSDWEKARKIVAENLKTEKVSDSRGNVLVELVSNNKINNSNGISERQVGGDGGDKGSSRNYLRKIKISHLSPDGKLISEFFASNSLEAQRIIEKNKLISQTSHALDIGGELAKAELALKKGLTYVQDKELVV